MLGICIRLKQYVTSPPYLSTVEDENGLVCAACMTPPFHIVLYSQRTDDEKALLMLIQNLREHKWSVPGINAPALLADKFAKLWGKETGQTCHLATPKRLFQINKIIPPLPAPGKLCEATENDLELVTSWITAGYEETMPGGIHGDIRQTVTRAITNRDYYLWKLEDGSSVSLACKTRPVINTISIGPVYTPPEQRGKGYASNCVAALSQLLLESGWKYCNLFTDLANPTANSIYQKIGYYPLCDFHEYNFR